MLYHNTEWQDQKNLYIPIWFYSNVNGTKKGHCSLRLYIPIWFYSNLLLLEKDLLKINFTFQSGSILIDSQNKPININIVFTFQSGSILILCAPTYPFLCSLYIPIWFYSNIACTMFSVSLPPSLHSNLVLF